MERAKQLYEEAIGLDFINGFCQCLYVPEIGFAPLVRPAGSKGYQLMTESAERGYAPAQYLLGIYHLFEHHHRNAAIEQITNIQHKMTAQEELEKQDFQTGINCLEQAAAQNYGEACLLLGDLLSENVFCGGLYLSVTDDSRAFFYYCKGAQAGNTACMYRVGNCHYHGWGTPEDNNSAFMWFCRARDAGCDLMWQQLGECYSSGFGTEKNIPLAIESFEKVLKQKNSNFTDAAHLKLACIYEGVFGFQYADFQKARQHALSIEQDGSEMAKNAQNLLNELSDAESAYQNWQRSQNQKSKPSRGCYIATAVYGSYDCPEVWTLRRFRDNVLAETFYGRALIHIYYAISPTLVKWFGNAQWFKNMWKPTLDKLVQNLNKAGVENTAYNDRVL